VALLYKTLHDALGFRIKTVDIAIGKPPGDPMAHVAQHGCDGSRRARGDEPVRHTQAMVPEPNDDPNPDEEPDDETDDEPEDDPDDERDDEPEPGTLYFGEDDGWTAQSC
jgi:hypothetical protein